MRTRKISFEGLRSEIITLPEERESNQEIRQTAASVLWAAMNQELTPRQRQCVELCVLQGMTQVDASKLLGLNKATVCRHMQKAVSSLRKAACYAGLDKLFTERR